MSDFVNLLWTAVIMVGLVISFSDLLVRRWKASGWSFLIAVLGTAIALANYFPEAALR